MDGDLLYTSIRIHNPFQISGDKTQRQKKTSLKTKSIIEWSGSYCPIQNLILKKQDTLL